MTDKVSAERMERAKLHINTACKPRLNVTADVFTYERLIELMAAFAAEEVRLLEIENNSLREFGRMETERCAKAVCHMCRNHECAPTEKDEAGDWRHNGFACNAAVIWELSRDGRE